MRSALPRRGALAVTTLALATALPAAPAAAADPAGVRCGLSTWTNPFDPDRTWGEFDAGPLVLDADPAAQPVRGSVTCTLVDGFHHDSPVLASATSRTTPGVVALEPTFASFHWSETAILSVCTSVDVAGRDRLHHDPTLGDDGGWTADATARCQPVFGPAEPLPLVDDVWLLLDSIVCPALAVAFPPQGDVPGVWDCPPYGS
jgi:hypothetical protein